jgi:hypothetical protein
MDFSLEYEAHYSKLQAVIVLLVAGGISVQPAWLIVGALGSREGVWVTLGLLLLAVWAVFILPFIVLGLKALFTREAVIILDADGVTDVRRDPSYAAWDDISNISTGWDEYFFSLRFEFRDHAKAKEYVGSPYWPLWILRRLVGAHDWNLNMLLLDRSRTEMVEVAEAYRQNAIRRRIEEANAGRQWSGALQ